MDDSDKNGSINSTERKKGKVRNVWSEGTSKGRPNTNGTKNSLEHDKVRKLMGKPLQQPAGPLWGSNLDGMEHHSDQNNDQKNHHDHDDSSFIPEVQLFEGDGRSRKRILVLCTGGTLTMAPDPNRGGALAPVEGAISKYMSEMNELHDNPSMPEFVLHEFQ
jgi:hypothetical protein